MSPSHCHGTTDLLQVPYARSEAHLTELLERVCEKMKEYGEKVDPATHRKSYVRVISHDGTKMDLSGVKIDGDVTSSLKFAVRAGLLGHGGGFGWRDPHRFPGPSRGWRGGGCSWAGETRGSPGAVGVPARFLLTPGGSYCSARASPRSTRMS